MRWRIAVSSVVKLHWKRDQEPSVEVTLEDSLLPLLVTEVEGGTLTIRFKENINPTKEIVVTASAADLDALDGRRVDCTLEDVKSNRFELRLGSTSQCIMSGSPSRSWSIARRLRLGPAIRSWRPQREHQRDISSPMCRRGTGIDRRERNSKVTVTQVDSRGLKIDVSGTSQCMVSGKAAKPEGQLQEYGLRAARRTAGSGDGHGHDQRNSCGGNLWSD